MLSTLRQLISKNPLKQMAETDRKVLAICLVAAFVFWLILNLSQEYTIRRSVALEYIVDPERVLVGRMPETVEADITGQGWNLIWESLRPGLLPVTVDIRDRDNLRLTDAELRQQVQRRLSSGALTVKNLGFESVTILTTPKEGKRVPIRSGVKVDFAPGFLATEQARLVPDSVTISGATDVLLEITEWPTERLSLRNLSGDIRRVVALEAASEGLSLSRDEVTYELDVEPFIQKRIEVPVTAINVPEVDSFRLDPASVEIQVSVVQSAYESVGSNDFELVADLAGARNGEGRNSIPLLLRRRSDAAVSVFFTPRAVEFYLIRTGQ